MIPLVLRLLDDKTTLRTQLADRDRVIERQAVQIEQLERALSDPDHITALYGAVMAGRVAQ